MKNLIKKNNPWRFWMNYMPENNLIIAKHSNFKSLVKLLHSNFSTIISV